jgi:hypothetical protein
MKTVVACAVFLLSASVTCAINAQEAQESVPAARAPSLPTGVIKLDETVISGNQELPKVLYILPWREPGGLPDIELETEFIETDVFRRLYPPAYRRELSYFKTLDETE